MKGISEDFQFQFGAGFRSLPESWRLYIFILTFLFSFFSAQDSLSATISPETQITIIGKAQIYSSDHSFNQIVADQNVKVDAVINYNSDDRSIVLTSEKKTKSLSDQVKNARERVFTAIDQSVLDKLEIAKEVASKGISFKNPVTENFFYSGNKKQINFIVPHSQNDLQNGYLVSFVGIISGFIHPIANSNFYLNTRSKKFGYSTFYSLRPPPKFS